MKKKKHTDFTHLTREDREFIEHCLENYDSKELNFKVIADTLAKDPTTISKEIKRNRVKQKESGYANIYHNLCENQVTCTLKDVCNTGCKHTCKKCEHCNEFCKSFKKMECKKVLRPPYVCNGCKTKGKCKYEKYFYKADKAQKKYQELLSETRSGLNMTWTEFKDYERILKENVPKGQSLYHIKKANPEIPFEVSTMYQHIEKGWIDVKNVDLIRKVKLKIRKKTALEAKKIAARKIGRTYDDFLDFLAKHPFTPVVEMDTVIGRQEEEPVLLTFLHRDSNLFWSFVLESKTSENVINKINELYEKLGHKLFTELCPVILTDNGSEFENPEEIEYTIDGRLRCRVFYCRPMRSGDKGKLEETHTLVRRVLPKKTSFIGLTQDKVDLMNNHINNYSRKELNGSTPFNRAQLVIKKKTLDILKLHDLDLREVRLKPSLIK